MTGTPTTPVRGDEAEKTKPRMSEALKGGACTRIQAWGLRLQVRLCTDYHYTCDQRLADWLDKPLVELGADRAGAR